MRIKTFFFAAVIGVAVVSGIFLGLSSPRRQEKKEEWKDKGAGKG